jgi:ATP-dependent DNA helicase RecG
VQASGQEIDLLTGRDKARRDATLARLGSGELKLIVGTHALVQEDVEFGDLCLAIVDEQHRFGVEQRMALADKGAGVDLLVMTATPIPRTLMMTAYGDIDVSRLTEKPAGRQPIDTRTVPLERLHEVADGLVAIAHGARISGFPGGWVRGGRPRGHRRHRMLRQRSASVGLAHGKRAAERDHHGPLRGWRSTPWSPP